MSSNSNNNTNNIITPKHILVTGGAGYVGNILCEQLLKNGYNVTCLDNLFKGTAEAILRLFQYKNFTFHNEDILNLDKDFLNKFDGIIHLAAIVGLPACKRNKWLSDLVNFKGTTNILENRREGVPFVFASTGSVYGKVSGTCTEETYCNPLSYYGRQKLEAEKIVRCHPNTISLRFATGFGVSPCMRVNLLVNDLCYKAVHDRSLTIFQADAYRTFINVRDMVSAFIEGLEKLFNANNVPLKYNVFNVGTEANNWTKRQLAEYIGKLSGCVVNYNDFDKDEDQRDYYVDYTLYREHFNEPEVSIEEGIEELFRVCHALKTTKYEYI